MKAFCLPLVVISVYIFFAGNLFSLCKYKAASKEQSVPPTFLLSMALRQQALAKQEKSNRQQKTQFHKQAIVYFRNYTECMNRLQRKPHSETYLRQAISHYRLRQYSKALQTVDQALTNIPVQNAYLLKARILVKQRQLQKASDTIEQVIHLYPESMDMLLLLASVNAELRQHKKSQVYFMALLDILGQRQGFARYQRDILRYLGDIYTRLGNSEKAVEKYIKYLTWQSYDIKVMLLLSRHLAILGRLDEATQQLQKVLHRYPGQANALSMLLEIRILQGKKQVLDFINGQKKLKFSLRTSQLFTVAEEVFQGQTLEKEKFLLGYLKKHPLELAAHLTLLEVYKKDAQMGRLAERYKQIARLARSEKKFYLAIRMLKQYLQQFTIATRSRKERVGVYSFLANCYVQNQEPAKALGAIDNALAIAANQSTRFQLQYQKAYILRLTGLEKYQDSLQVLQDMKSSQTNAEIEFLKGMNYFALEQYQKAKRHLDRAIRLQPKNALFYFYRANCRDKLHEDEKLQQDLLQAIHLDKNYSPPKNYLGFLYAEKDENKDKAEAYILDAVALEPGNIAYRDSLGWIYYKKKKYREALFQFKLASLLMQEQGHFDPIVYEHLGYTYHELLDTTEAIKSFQKALQYQKEVSKKKELQQKIEELQKTKLMPNFPPSLLDAVESSWGL
ncbi:MAG: tetratricopeptide repeat protein [Spirochaetota bacterium]